MILIFTNKEDAHPNPVIDILTERGVPFFRLNTEALLTDYVFTWEAISANCDFHIACTANDQVVIGSEITTIWDRRPEKPDRLPLRNTPEIDAHNLQEALGFLWYLRYYLDDVPSIGSILNDRYASSKMVQSQVAIDCGFTIPHTLFTNRKTEMLRFGAEHDFLCLKSIENGDIWDQEQGMDYVFYTQRIRSDQLPQIPDEAYTQTATFTQEYVPKLFELRVTVVGDELFATRIDSQSLDDVAGKVDWRQGYDAGLHLEPFTLPERIKKRCLLLVHSLGLNFGCIDLIVRPDGEYVFLECNPNGQWLWVELATGQKISKSIADWLSDPASRRLPREYFRQP